MDKSSLRSQGAVKEVDMPEKYITQAVHVVDGNGFEVDNGRPVYIQSVTVSTTGTSADVVFTESSVSGNINNALLSVVLSPQVKTVTAQCGDFWLADKGFRVPALPANTRVTVFYRRYSSAA